RSSAIPWRASICDCRYSGSESQNLLTTTCTINASVGMPPSMGRAGASATTIASSQGPAGVAWAPHHPHAQLRRSDVELLGAQFADAVHAAAATGTRGVLDIDEHFV